MTTHQPGYTTGRSRDPRSAGRRPPWHGGAPPARRAYLGRAAPREPRRAPLRRGRAGLDWAGSSWAGPGGAAPRRDRPGPRCAAPRLGRAGPRWPGRAAPCLGRAVLRPGHASSPRCTAAGPGRAALAALRPGWAGPSWPGRAAPRLGRAALRAELYRAGQAEPGCTTPGWGTAQAWPGGDVGFGFVCVPGQARSRTPSITPGKRACLTARASPTCEWVLQAAVGISCQFARWRRKRTSLARLLGDRLSSTFRPAPKIPKTALDDVPDPGLPLVRLAPPIKMDVRPGQSLLGIRVTKKALPGPTVTVPGFTESHMGAVGANSDKSVALGKVPLGHESSPALASCIRRGRTCPTRSLPRTIRHTRPPSRSLSKSSPHPTRSQQATPVSPTGGNGRGRRYVLGGTHIDDLYRRIGGPYDCVTEFLR